MFSSSESFTSQMASLDVDVLDAICAFLTDSPDLLTLSLTSSALRPLAIRHLLRNCPVVLKNVDTIFKFHDFVFSAPASRLQHVTALTVFVLNNESHPEGSERAVDCLLAILKQASSLMSLQLLSTMDLGYIDDPRISAAVGSLETLRELKIAGQPKAADFIGAVRSLTKLTLQVMAPQAGGPDWTPATLRTTLSHLAQSLESLAIIHGVRLAMDHQVPDSPSPVTQFHALRSLTVQSLVVTPHLAHLIELFPNLDGTLHLMGFEYEDVEAVGGYERRSSEPICPVLRAARERNGRAQDRRCWKRIARLVCDVDTLFVLNLRCPLGLILIPACQIDDASQAQCLSEALREHPPARLNLQFVIDRRRPLGVEYAGMIPPEAAATLTHLTVCIKHQYVCCGDREPIRRVRWDDLWVSRRSLITTIFT